MIQQVFLSFLILSSAFAFADQAQTATGIPLDTAWKQKVFEFAQKNVVHPSWGIAHSERNYQVAKSLAQKDGIALDTDVLFVAAFLHDLGGIPPHDKEGVDHAERSVQVIEPLLQEWGFPIAKWPQVREMILGHSYYGPAPASPAAQAFRDADIVDFLGTIGAARLLAITQEPGRASPVLKPIVGVIKDFNATLPAKCSLKSCHDLAAERVKETQRLLNELSAASFQETAL